MKKVVPILIVLVVVVGAVVLLMNKKSNDKTNSSYSSSSSSNMGNMSSSQSSASTDKQATDKVTISNYAFSPANITVKKGTTVTWTNQDSVGHNVTETDGKAGPNSQTLANGQSYQFTFTTAGTYNYHCSIHPDMVGTVTVTE